MNALLLCLITLTDPFEEGAILLSTVPGLGLSEGERGEMELSGVIERLSDHRKIIEFLRRHPAVQNKTRLSQGVIGSIQRKLQSELKSLGIIASISRSGSTFRVSGEGVDERTLKRLREIYSGVERQGAGRRAITEDASIFLEISLIEVKKTAFEKLGLRLGSPMSIEAQLGLNFLGGRSSSGQIGMGDPLKLFLDLALQKGEARIHAKQSIVAENGHQGEFQAGGEFPIRIVQGMVSRVEFKPYGLILRFTPLLKDKSLVQLNIHSEISEIDTGSLVDGLPVISKKDLRTKITARLDDLIAIGGLVRSSQSGFVDSIPGLSALPVLGSLFESDDFKTHKSEAYIFVKAKKLERGWLPQFQL
jgi:pilus assembly protein CpaC